jgi:hypothetical protein
MDYTIRERRYGKVSRSRLLPGSQVRVRMLYFVFTKRAEWNIFVAGCVWSGDLMSKKHAGFLKV